MQRQVHKLSSFDEWQASYPLTLSVLEEMIDGQNKISNHSLEPMERKLYSELNKQRSPVRKHNN